jgi:hypothetical protein
MSPVASGPQEANEMGVVKMTSCSHYGYMTAITSCVVKQTVRMRVAKNDRLIVSPC